MESLYTGLRVLDGNSHLHDNYPLAIPEETLCTREKPDVFEQRGLKLDRLGLLLQKISSIPPESDYYNCLAETLKDETEALAAALFEYVPSRGTLRPASVAGGPEILKKRTEIIGGASHSVEVPVTLEAYKHLIGTPVETGKDISDIGFFTLTPGIYKILRSQPGISVFQRLTFTTGKTLIGSALFLFADSQSALDHDVATLLARICALAIREQHTLFEKNDAEARSRQLLDILPESIFEMNDEGIITYASTAALECFDYTKEQMESGIKLISLVAPEDRQRAIANIERVLTGKHSRGPSEYSLLRQDGSRFHGLVSSTVISLEDGKSGMTGVVVDLSKIRYDDSYRAQLVAAVEQSTEAMMITDNIARIQYANPALLRITGTKRESLIGKLPFALVKAKEEKEGYAMLCKALQSGEIWHGMIEGRREDGKIYKLDTNVSPVRGDSGAVINSIAVMRDVTYEHELEARYQHSQKMEAIGRLAGGIAHDFNNLMTAIAGYAELILDTFDKDDSRRNDLKEITDAVDRASSLTGQLLTFSRKQAIQPKPTDVKKTIAAMRAMLRRLLGEDIDIDLYLEENLPLVYIDPVQIEQIMMNLAVNARDAMPGGGTLSVHVTREGRFVFLDVRDTGEGMDDETLSRIFEPFFTTKLSGEGTGLGLSTVYGIVEQNNGEIKVESKPGLGARFLIKFPVIDAAATLGNQEDKENNIDRESKDVIMLVEDEELVRKLTAKVLDKAGFEVVAFGNPLEAVKKAKEENTRISLLITDVVMPEMNGKDLADTLIGMKPDLKVLFMSGYTNEVLSLRGIENGSLPFIQKPFSPAALIEKAEELLNG